MDIKKQHKHWFYLNWHYDIKRVLKMAELHALWNMMITLGYTTYVYALFISLFNVDNVTRWIVSITGALFLIAQFIIKCVAAYRKHQYDMIDIRMKKHEEKERALSIREREMETYERETSIIMAFKE